MLKLLAIPFGVAGLPGLGLLRRLITMGLCAGSFWGGLQVERLLNPKMCLEPDGHYSQDACQKDINHERD